MKISDKTILNVIIGAITLSLVYFCMNFNMHLFELGARVASTPTPFNEVMFNIVFNKLDANGHYVDAICFALGYYIY